MEFLEEKGRIYAVDANGKLLAEVTFPDDGNTAVIDHTFVDESLRGRGQPLSCCGRRWIRSGVKAKKHGRYALMPRHGLKSTQRKKICWKKPDLTPSPVRYF